MFKAYRSIFGFLSILLLLGFSLHGQERNGTISGHVADVNQDVLVGARVELQPNGFAATTDAQGAFTISNLAPGKYTLSVSYLGFKPFSKEVTVASGSVTNIDAALEIETVNQQVVVRGERERGEVEAINREMNADNIVQVLPAEVLTSLPNTNIADAVGRLPSVSLERDEGEGKYVQVRGTEPRLTNLTLDGVHVPSPESVRQVKLDAIPADLVDSVEINKTLSPSQEGDAIGGSVNLVTKRAGERPFMSVQAMGGYTPVGLGGRLNEFDSTIGKRFGREKRLGLLFGGSYDYNQRGTDDIEPAPGTNDFGTPGNPNIQPVFFGMDVREYKFYRHRYGFVGSADYKLGQGSLAYLRGRSQWTRRITSSSAI
ncbi:MAG TPA: carboxypeptidase regulatory-like domain-containing protein [Candidatus Acidoferrum sp.]